MSFVVTVEVEPDPRPTLRFNVTVRERGDEFVLERVALEGDPLQEDLTPYLTQRTFKRVMQEVSKTLAERKPA